ncbi:MAG: glycoside hydrolase family 127 protein, partial [Acidobacteriaceae bacterium]|nr:glycoside hydrolase family 127 protein [Acidobacteriaceae bacterium]
MYGATLIRVEYLAVLLLAAPALAKPPKRAVVTPPQPAIVNAVADVYRALPPDQEKIGGVIGARLRANSEGYIEKIAAGAADEGDGKLLDAAIYTFEYNHDPQVNAVVLRLAKKLIASQSPEGYFGRGSGADQWIEKDTWAQGAALLGLLNYYRLTGDQNALLAATKSGD